MPSKKSIIEIFRYFFYSQLLSINKYSFRFLTKASNYSASDFIAPSHSVNGSITAVAVTVGEFFGSRFNLDV